MADAKVGSFKNSDRYRKARSCKHCTDSADSFNRYVSTYCHLRHKHMAGITEKDTLDQCLTCPDYEKRGE